MSVRHAGTVGECSTEPQFKALWGSHGAYIQICYVVCIRGKIISTVYLKYFMIVYQALLSYVLGGEGERGVERHPPPHGSPLRLEDHGAMHHSCPRAARCRASRVPSVAGTAGAIPGARAGAPCGRERAAHAQRSVSASGGRGG